MKLFIVDGIDNSGKSRAVKSVKECGICGVDFSAFPSKSLSESKVFMEVATNPTQENKAAWLHALINEEREVIRSSQAHAMLIDRMWFSTLIYQGDGCGDFLSEIKINHTYERLMKDLNILPTDVYHFLFRYPLSYNTDKETNVAKKVFDKKRDVLFQKQEALIHKLSGLYPPLKSEYLDQLMIFDEPELKEAFDKRVRLSSSKIDHIQMLRANVIESYLESVI